MAESDILNPVQGFWRDLNDNPNPSYGYTRKSASNSALAKTRLGAPYTRETMNQGFAFEFTYVDRPWSTILRLKHFYEAFKGGYFTYIDYDGGGRHHVGRFTSPVNGMQTANGKYTVQGLVFEEIPRARMIDYPANFTDWGRTICVVDDFLNTAVATYQLTPGSWVTQLNPAIGGATANKPIDYELYSATPNWTVAPYDWAQIQYVGWGFKMKFRIGSGMGKVSLYIDGTFSGGLDLSNSTAGSLPSTMSFVGGTLIATQMPLDMHRIQIQTAGAGIVGGGSAINFPPVTVIV
jgi:hypothetical protein